ncbi:MAG: alkaline phosphatase family protein [Verrucomicrobiaceae bacterium]|nr:alkaline phosphatase family protein [Verrucomicrobiaceae bacterium]
MIRSLILLAFAISASSHAAGPAEHVILVSIDGWAHHYFEDPKCQMPAVKTLAANGARAKRMECSYPTVTWTNHTTLVTGVQPGKHGVIGNDYFDRAQRKKDPPSFPIPFQQRRNRHLPHHLRRCQTSRDDDRWCNLARIAWAHQPWTGRYPMSSTRNF